MIEVSDVRRDQFLESYLAANLNQGFIAGQILLNRSVSEDSGLVGGISDDHLREYNTERALYDRSLHLMQHEYDTPVAYKIVYHDLAEYIPQRLLKQNKDPFDVRRDAVMVTKNAIMLKREMALAAKLTSTSVLTQNDTLLGSDQFSDPNSQPETVIEDAKSTIHAAVGAEADSAVFSRKAFNDLKRHPWVLSQFTGLKTVSSKALYEFLKDYFDLQNLYVAKAIKVSSKEGQTVTKADVWNNDVLIYVKGQDGIFTPSLGLSLSLDGYDPRVVNWEDPVAKKGEFVESSIAFDDVIVKPESAFLIKNATADLA